MKSVRVVRAFIRCHFLAALLAASSLRAEPSLEFVGVLTTGQHTPPQLCLADRATEESRWMQVGSEFRGFVVRSYDPETESAILGKDGAETRLFLPRASVKSTAGSLPPASVAAIRGNLRLLVSAARLHFLEGRSRYATLDDLVGPGKYIRQLTAIAGEEYGGVAFMKGELGPLTVTAKNGEAVSFVPE
jgi:hypothetical protein